MEMKSVLISKYYLYYEVFCNILLDEKELGGGGLSWGKMVFGLGRRLEKISQL